MSSLTKTLAIAAMSAAFLAPVASVAQTAAAGESMDANQFVKMCDTDKDGMVSKAEMMKMVEKMFDKQDKKKMGKLDKKQVEFFLQELMKGGG